MPIPLLFFFISRLPISGSNATQNAPLLPVTSFTSRQQSPNTMPVSTETYRTNQPAAGVGYKVPLCIYSIGVRNTMHGRIEFVLCARWTHSGTAVLGGISYPDVSDRCCRSVATVRNIDCMPTHRRCTASLVAVAASNIGAASVAWCFNWGCRSPFTIDVTN